jgi:hypothetical protein
MRKPRDLFALLLMLVFFAGTASAQEPKRLSDAVRDFGVSEAGQATVPPPNDSLLNGALIGAAVGFGAGYLTMAVANARATESGPIWDRDARRYYTMAGVIGAGIGAGIGALVDAMRKPRGRTQQRPGVVMLAPVYARGRTGAVVSIRY